MRSTCCQLVEHMYCTTGLTSNAPPTDSGSDQSSGPTPDHNTGISIVYNLCGDIVDHVLSTGLLRIIHLTILWGVSSGHYTSGAVIRLALIRLPLYNIHKTDLTVGMLMRSNCQQSR